MFEQKLDRHEEIDVVDMEEVRNLPYRDYVIALEEGCDIYISGDAPHHVRRGIVTDNFNYLDMPHEIEHIFMPQMKKVLLGIDSSLEVITFDHEKLPEVIKD